MSSDIENTAGLAVIESMGHTLLHSTIALVNETVKEKDLLATMCTDFDVDNVSPFVDLHVGGQWNSSILLEVACEQMTRTTAITFGVDHSSNGILIGI